MNRESPLNETEHTLHLERRPIRQIEVVVAEVIPQTPDSVTLVFFTGQERLEYRAGHFLTIDPHQFESLDRFIAFFEDVNGRREPPRAYSMSSAPHENHLAITVKEERYVTGVTKYPPLLSPTLVRAVINGRRLVVTGFTGPYTLPDDIESKTDHIVHLCAGSGSVPNLSILKSALYAHPRLRHTFLYSNKTWSDVIFRDELAELERRDAKRLRVVHTLTRETNFDHGERVRAGRVSTEFLRQWIPDPTSCWVYACGPAISNFERAAAKESGRPPEPRFLETAMASLTEIGVPAAQIKHESYG
jgi:3-ketosteroid 9alpha-monooxygenase subunit B